uniref:tRNA (adenine(58)-N(1))-methyltransferase catalytic subunit TRM61 n=1 Tax=Blastobotrys adeninivorans TaxID=409370 RepID=A0A060T5T2_BLAAD
MISLRARQAMIRTTGSWRPGVWTIRQQSTQTSGSGYLARFVPGDTVIIRGVVRPDRVALSKPLTPGNQWATPFGQFSHDQFIGRDPRTAVESVSGDKYIATHPTYEDYVINRMRVAQPIYPHDASAIVALADIHIDSQEQEVHHFMEAGTGHGSLTLAICKAIHAANQGQTPKAVLHSIDRNANHSKIGSKNVRDFRRGMYARDVQFHVGDPTHWLHNNGDVQLSGVFLDLPKPGVHLGTIAQRLKVDAPLVVFCPSISQIQEVVSTIHEDCSILLNLVNTVELMPGMGGSMRNWDVRVTTVKETGEQVNVCRPRVGSKIVGGGFVGVFRRLPQGARDGEMKRRAQTQTNVKDTDTKTPTPTQGGWFSSIRRLFGSQI